VRQPRGRPSYHITGFILLPSNRLLWNAEVQFGIHREKQKTDLLKGGTTSWLASIPITIALFLAGYVTGQGPVNVLWLPNYLFATLLVFSGSTLYYFRGA